MINDGGVIDLLKGDNALLDSKLMGVSVTQEQSANPTVELRFRARSGSAFSQVAITFIDVIAYELSYDENNSTLDIWDLKFLQLDDDSFYITLDPDPETLPAAGVVNVQASRADLFFIRARHITAMVTKADNQAAS